MRCGIAESGSISQWSSISEWNAFPSALVHLLTVESAPIYAAVYAGCLIVLDALRIDLHWLETHSDLEEFCQPGHVCHVASAMKYGVMLITPVAGALLVLFHFIYFVWVGPRSFGEGRYLRMTWKFERNCVYRTLVFLIAGGPLLFCIWVSFALRHASLLSDPHARNFLMAFLYDMPLNIIVLVFSLKRLLFPATPVHDDWIPEFDALVFKRSFVQMFTQSNDAFSVQLVDALWTADNKKSEPLQALLPSYESISSVRATCVLAEEKSIMEAITEEISLIVEK